MILASSLAPSSLKQVVAGNDFRVGVKGIAAEGASWSYNTMVTIS